MRLILDRGELKLIGSHVLSLFVPGLLPAQPDTYRDIAPGDLETWSPGSLDLLLEEGRRRLDAVNAQFEAIRNRSQYLLATSLAAAGVFGGLVREIVDSLGLFLLWFLGLVLLVACVLVSFAAFAATVQLGTVDPVLLSRQEGKDETAVARSLARAYAEAVRVSTTAVHVRFTLYRDAVWLFVAGVAVGTLAWTLRFVGA